MQPIALFVVLGVACRPTGPAEGATEVAVVAPVVFPIESGVHTGFIRVRWNYLGHNGRMPVRVSVGERRITVWPAEAVPWGTGQEVVVEGLAEPSGVAMAPLVRTFTTANNPVVWSFELYGPTEGQGRSCVLDDRGRLSTCDHFGAGTGSDGVPGSDDDEVVQEVTYHWEGDDLVAIDTHGFGTGIRQRTELTYGPRDTPRGRVVEPGPDGALGTDDDLPVWDTLHRFGDHGFQTHELVAHVSVGNPDFDLSRVARGTRFLVTDLGDDLGSLSIEDDGVDRVWGTDDDEVAPGWVATVDAAGQRVREDYLYPGDDGVPFTEDDEVLGQRWYVHRDGAREEFVQVDLDGQITDTWAYEWDRRGHLEGTTWYAGHPDVGSPDPTIVQHTRVRVVDGLRDSEIAFFSPGPDESWYTDDDVPFMETRYGRRERPAESDAGPAR